MTATVDPALLAAVEAAVWQQSPRKRGREYAFTCPREGHNDDNPSARWNRDKATWYCDPCGQGGGVVDLARLLDIIPKANPNAISYRLNRNGAQPIEHRRYTQDDGGKRFGWFTGGERGLDGTPASALPLYGVEHLRAGEPVVMTEGEKARDALIARGIAAVGTVCGASTSPTAAVLAPILSHPITLWPDNDSAGLAHMEAINRILRDLGVTEVHVVTWPDAPDKGDAADHTGTDEEVLALITAAPDYQPDDDGPADFGEARVDRTVLGDLTLTWPQRGLRFVARDIERRRQHLQATLSVLAKPGPAEKARTLVADSRINLMSMSGKRDLTTALQSTGRDEPWRAIIEQAASLIQDNWQVSEPPVLLDDVPDPGPMTYLVTPILQENEHTVLFADGGTGKSTVALGVVVSVGTGQLIVPGLIPQKAATCLYLDWERNARPHRRRYNGILQGAGLEPAGRVHYRRMTGLLTDAVEELRRFVNEKHIELIVADSVGMACGGQINDESAVIAYFDAARVIGGTWLSIAHVKKDESHGKPIGSQYWYAQPQGGTYELLGTAEEGQSSLGLTLIHRKTNDERHPTLAWEVGFDSDGAIRWGKADPVATTTDQRQLPLSVRLKAALLRQGNRTAKELAEELGAPQNSVISSLKRSPGLFLHLGVGRPERWGVATIEDDRSRANTANTHENPTANTQSPSLQEGGVAANTPGLRSAEDEEEEELPWKETP